MVENRFPFSLRWRTAEQGGRARTHTGPSYRTTASRRGDPHPGAFSVGCRFDENDGVTAHGWLALLAPENFPEVLEQLAHGAELTLYEGPRPTADVRVLVPAIANV